MNFAVWYLWNQIAFFSFFLYQGVSKDKESPKKEKKAQLSVEQIKKLLSQVRKSDQFYLCFQNH